LVKGKIGKRNERKGGSGTERSGTSLKEKRPKGLAEERAQAVRRVTERGKVQKERKNALKEETISAPTRRTFKGFSKQRNFQEEAKKKT